MSTKKMLLAMMAVAAFAFAALPAVASAEETKFDTTPSLNGAAGVGFTSTSKVGHLYIEGSEKPVECQTDTNEGEFTTSMTGTVVVTFHECKFEGLACTTPGQPKGTIQTTELAFHLVYLDPEGGEPHERPGILFTPHEGHFATFTCAGGLVHIEVRGSGVAGTITSPKIGGEANKAVISVKATAAGQEHTTVTATNEKEEEKSIKFGLEASVNGGGFVGAYEDGGEDTVTLNGGVEATTET